MEVVIAGPLVVVGGLFVGTAAVKKFFPLPPEEAAAAVSAQAHEEALAEIELDLALATAIASDDDRAELLSLFNALDKDVSGSVSSKEWGSAVGKHRATLSKFFGGATPAEIGKQFERLDVDGSKDLSWDEFAGGVMSIGATIRIADALETDAGQAELKKVFSALDKDGDGKVTSKEFGSAMLRNPELVSKFFGKSLALTAAGLSGDIVAEMAAAKTTLNDAAAAAKAAVEKLESARKGGTAAQAAGSAAEGPHQQAADAVAKCEQRLKAATDAATAAKAALEPAEAAEKAIKPKDKRKLAEAKKAVDACQTTFKRAQSEVDAAQKSRDVAAKAVKEKAAAKDAASQAVAKAEEHISNEQAALQRKEAELKAATENWEAFSTAEKEAVTEIAQVFRRLDSDKSNTLTWPEFVAAAASMTDTRPAQAFALIDRNGNGKASYADVSTALQTDQFTRDALGCSKEAFEQICQHLATDQNKTLTLAQFRKLLAPHLTALEA